MENEIKECGKRLQEIQLEMIKETDKYSDGYLNLEQERINLRKRVMDLDYEHKVTYANQMKEKRQKEAEERERKQKEVEE